MSFGAPTSAPSTGGFSFGGAAPTAAGAPSTTGGLFGSAPAPSTPFGASTFGSGGFGSSPAPSAPAPSGSFSGFGSSTAAPSTGGLFGSGSLAAAGASAPTGSFSGFGFGSSASAVPFGTTPAPAPFGASAAPPTPAAIAATISLNIPYSQLTADQKRSFDTLHDAIMKHKRTMLMLKSMGPTPLQKGKDTKEAPITRQLHEVRKQNNSLLSELEQLYQEAHRQYQLAEKQVVQATYYAKWPVEAVAVRKGLRFEEEKKSDADQETAAKVRQALDRGMAAVDRIEEMPSPFLWDAIHDMEQRVDKLLKEGKRIEKNQAESRVLLSHLSTAAVADKVESQQESLQKLSANLSCLSKDMEALRDRYRRFEHGDNVLDKAAVEEYEREKHRQEALLLQFLQATGGAASTSAMGAAPATNNPAPTPPFSFSSSASGTPAPASPAPAPFAFATPTATSKKKSGSRSSARLRK